MANTYTLISSNVLSSAAANVTFTSIPSAYKDLIIKWSSRAATDTSASAMEILINSSTSGYSFKTIRVSAGNTPQSTSGSAQASASGFYNQPNDYTASTFSNAEIYIPNYAGSNNKSYVIDNVIENNATAANYSPMGYAGVWSNTNAITSILLRSASGNLAAGSSFYLYGVKNS